MQIIPDKKTYRAGETAKILIVTGKPNTPVLVSLEGRDLRSHKLMRSSESTIVLEVPVTAQDEPGIWVNAQFVRKGAMYQGAKYVKVPPEDHKLNINVATDKPQYQPGETAQYTVQVTTPDGKPMPRRRAQPRRGGRSDLRDPPRHDAGSAGVFLRAGVEHGPHRRLAELLFQRRGGEAPHAAGGAARSGSRLAQLKPDRMVQPKIRKAFPDTAFWNADLVTDAAGKAQAKVEFPDSLTTWRATARAVTPDTQRRRRDGENHRAQESHPAPRCAALLRAGR